jgi:hypothetical protein
VNPDDLFVLGFLANVPAGERAALLPDWMVCSLAIDDLLRAQRDAEARSHVYRVTLDAPPTDG